jgi:hypothetical protein
MSEPLDRSGQVLLLKFDKFHIVHTGHPYQCHDDCLPVCPATHTEATGPAPHTRTRRSAVLTRAAAAALLLQGLLDLGSRLLASQPAVLLLRNGTK